MPASQPDPTGGAQTTGAGFVLANGASVSGLGTGCAAVGGGTDTIIVDWNGTTGPNIEGDDQMIIQECFDTGGCGSSVIRAGQLAVHSGTYPTSYAFYGQIFK